MRLKYDVGSTNPVLNSPKNEKIKFVAKLIHDSKLRKEAKTYVAEGIRLFSDTIENDILEVFCTEDIEEKIKNSLSPERAEEALLKLGNLRERGKVVTVSEEAAKKISDTENPQGITALIRIREREIADVMKENDTFILIIERLQDPGNLGTIIRTAEGAGVTGIVISRDSVDVYNPKVVRGTMGSLFRMPIYISDDLKKDIEIIKEAGVTVYGTHLSGNDMYDESFDGKVAFLIGNEGAGLSDEISAAADKLLRIPMEGKVESLNVGVSAAVVCYEVMRQRRG